jgi:hypothetical protein
VPELKRTLPLAALATALRAAAACSRVPAAPRPAPDAPAQVMSDRLFFGRNVPSGGTVTDSAWTVFLAEVVTPRFPDGFTTWRTEGQWRGADGAIAREAGFVLQVDHPPGVPPDSTFEAIAVEYGRRFRQEAVLRTRTPAQLWLYRAVPR